MTEPSNYYYFFEQINKLAIGIVLAAIITVIPRRLIKKLKILRFLL